MTTTASFLTSELPVRYAHQLRLLSTLTPDALQTPIIRHVAYRYLHDICTLLHPSLQNTSPRGFTETVKRIRSRQAASLVRLRYVLRSATPSTVALMDNISTISLGIQMLIGMYISRRIYFCIPDCRCDQLIYDLTYLQINTCRGARMKHKKCKQCARLQ